MKNKIKNFLFKKRIKILRNKKGFSLMELLIVVSIMGVISAIAIPAYDKYRSNANEAGAKAEAKTVYRALNTCLASGKAASACATSKVDGTISKECIIAYHADHDKAKQITDDDKVKGKCFIAEHNNTTPDPDVQQVCVASNIGGKVYCIDNTTGEHDDKGCTLKSGATKGVCG